MNYKREAGVDQQKQTSLLIFESHFLFNTVNWLEVYVSAKYL